MLLLNIQMKHSEFVRKTCIQLHGIQYKQLYNYFFRQKGGGAIFKMDKKGENVELVKQHSEDTLKDIVVYHPRNLTGKCLKVYIVRNQQIEYKNYFF